MKIMPAVDIMNGRVVQLVGGKPGTERVVLPHPVDVAVNWEERGAPRLHVVDLDGAFGRGRNTEIVKEIIRELSIPVQVGGGIRKSEMVSDLLGWGAEAVVVGTKAITEPAWLEEISINFPGRVILALDVKEGLVQVRGWQESSGISLEEMFRMITPLALSGVLYTNVDIEGQASGIDRMKVAEFVKGCPHPVIASGGISSMEDIEALKKIGVRAGIVGLALYMGKLDPEQIWGEKR